MYIVKSPVENYNGVSAGVEFKDGIGKTDNKQALDWFKKKGYKVDKEKPRDTGSDEKPLSKMTVSELDEKAAKMEIDVSDCKNKTEKVAAIQAALDSADGEADNAASTADVKGDDA